MIDASKGFMKDGPKNRLRSQDIHKIVDAFNKQIEIDRYSRMVPLAEIAEPKNDYNLNIPRYIDSSEPEDMQDLHAHLHGGIPDRDIDAAQPLLGRLPAAAQPAVQAEPSGYSDLAWTSTRSSRPSSTHPSSSSSRAAVRSLDGRVVRRPPRDAGRHRRRHQARTTSSPPSATTCSPGSSRSPLLDEYDVYEQLMTYWHDIMHDDVFLVMNDGWLDAAKPRKAIEDKDRKLTETPDLVIGSGRSAAKYKMDLVPPALIVARYFADEQAKVDELTAAAEEASRAVEEYIEEHGVEDGLLGRGHGRRQDHARRWQQPG